MAWQTPKTNWDTHPKAIEPSDMNRIEGNILAVREQISIPLRAEVVDSFPPHAAGRIIYHTGHKRAYVSDGSAWVAVSIEGDADVEHVLAGKTFSSRIAGVGAAGTMPNRGAVVITPGTSNKAIPAGYHNGEGYVVGAPVATGSCTVDSAVTAEFTYYDHRDSRKRSKPYVLVTGLKFKPSFVLILKGNAPHTAVSTSANIPWLHHYHYENLVMIPVNLLDDDIDYSFSSVYGYILDGTRAYLKQGTFKLPVDLTTGYTATFNWLAIGDSVL